VESVNQIITDNSVPTYLFGAHLLSRVLFCLNLNTLIF